MNSSLRFLNFSPNSSKMNTPLAESTAIGSPLAKQFQGNTKRKSISPISNANKLRPSMTGMKIDPHVLTDAQSNGIVSRLVKYYDQSNEPEKSRTVYNKFGDFPIVQLKKTELKRPLIRSTSVRIAPPNKTVMNPNLRAAIMRSSSFQLNSGLPKIIPTKMRAKDDSHKIITNHEPITDPNYPVSSKSVLDALEKNCRKRINNEELILDRSKKVCAPVIPEVVDSPKEFMPISSIPQSAKRNREELSPEKVSYPRTILDSTNNQQSKRVKTKNNALLSSLSSSHYELPALNSTLHNNSRISSVPLAPKAIVSKQKEVEIINEEVNKVKIVDTKVSELKPQKEVEQPAKRLQLFNARPDPNAALNRAKLRAFDDNEDEDDELKIRFVKPKEKVLENYDVINYVEKDKLNKMLKGLSQGIKSPVKENQEKGRDTIDSKTTSISVEKQPVASISFTTSTTSSTIAPISTPASTSNAVISTNPSTSILSNLVNNDKKETDSGASKTSSIPSLISNSAVTSSNSSSTSTESTVLKPIVGGFSFGSTTTTTQSEVQKSTSILSTSVPSNTSIASSIGIQSKPLSPLALFSNPKSDTTANDPNKSLISFTPIKPTENVQSSNLLPSITSSAPTLPAFGTSTTSTGFKFGESSASKTDDKPLTGFNFGSNTAQTEKVEAPKALGGFSFGGSNTTAQNSVTTSTPSFSFGSNQSAPKLPTTSPLLPSTTSQTSNLTFQSPTTTVSSGMFNFGGNSAAPSFTGIQSSAPTFGQSVAQSQSSVPTFGQNTGIMTSPNTTSFNKQPETTVASGVGFSFGGDTNKPTNSGFSFGNSASTTNANSVFTGFGAATTAQSTGIFSSAVTTTSAPSFSFNSNTINTSNNNTTNSPFTGFGAINPTVTKAEPPSMFGSFKPQTAPVTTNSAFEFGKTMNTSTTAVIQPSQNTAFTFGQSGSTNNNENKPTGIFARLGEKQTENKPFSFGGNNTNNLQQSSPSFGTINSPLSSTSSAPNIFGSPSSAPVTNSSSVFGQTPVLGSNNSAGNLFSSNNNQATNSPFGNNLSQNNNNSQQQSGGNLFAFGGASSSNTNNTNNQPSSGMFNFGGSNNNNNNNTNQVNSLSSNNIFGSASNANNSGQNVSASFTFNTATGNVSNSQQQATSPFGQQQQQQNSAPPPYQFGQSAIGNNVSASFSFSGASSAPVTSQTPQNTQMFNFGSSGTSAVPGSFNFQGQQSIQPPQPSPGPGGLFNIGTGGNQQRRPARVATRRYK